MIKGFINEFAYLSNFYMCSIVYEGILYPSSEHAFAAAKTLDTEIRKHISTLQSPGQAKRAGRQVELRKDWDVIRVSIMYNILKCKFTQNQVLKNKLLCTKDEYLEETNDWNDTFWGVCNGVGRNHLGHALMMLRSELRSLEQ